METTLASMINVVHTPYDSDGSLSKEDGEYS